MVKRDEWPLMVFTLFSQLAVGTFIMSLLVMSLLNADHPDLADKIIRQGIFAAVVVMAMALSCSLFHLGHPLLAFMSIANTKSSWLSREILTAGGFFFIALVYAVMYSNGSLIPILGWFAVFVGLFNVCCMANIYRSTILPAWTNINTYIVFFGATFALGALGTAAGIALVARGFPLPDMTAEILRELLYISGCSILLPFLYLPLYLKRLKEGNGAAQDSARLLKKFSFIIAIRGLLSCAGLGLMLAAILYRAESGQSFSAGFIYAAAVLILMGEFLGRCIFYAAAVPMKIG